MSHDHSDCSAHGDLPMLQFEQSPLSLFKDDSWRVKVSKKFLKIDYSGGPYYGRFEGEAGHENFVLDRPYSGRKAPTIRLGGVKAKLVKIHMHTPSEHDLEGDDHAGEIHLIHKIIRPTGQSRLIVLGTLLDAVPEVDRCAEFQKWGACQAEAKVALDPAKFLPPHDADKPWQLRWYRYEGSLTSGRYDEIVSWLVFADPLGVHSDDLAELAHHADQPERDTQDLNRRFVLRNFR